MELSALLETTNQTRDNIIPDIYKIRLNFCKDKMQGKCSDNNCPIYRKYYDTGLSCNGALDKYPDECRALIRCAG